MCSSAHIRHFHHSIFYRVYNSVNQLATLCLISGAIIYAHCIYFFLREICAGMIFQKTLSSDSPDAVPCDDPPADNMRAFREIISVDSFENNSDRVAHHPLLVDFICGEALL